MTIQRIVLSSFIAIWACFILFMVGVAAMNHEYFVNKFLDREATYEFVHGGEIQAQFKYIPGILLIKFEADKNVLDYYRPYLKDIEADLVLFTILLEDKEGFILDRGRIYYTDLSKHEDKWLAQVGVPMLPSEARNIKTSEIQSAGFMKLEEK